MARHNFCYFLGPGKKKPKIISDRDGNLVRGQCMLTVVRGERSVEDDNFGDFKYDCPIIMSQNPDQIYEMAQWEEHDIVLVKGTISTRNIIRKSICPTCGHQNIKEGVLLYITPIHLLKVESGFSENQGFEYLRKHCEFSNQCIVAGNLCTDPIYYKYPNGMSQVQYQIALNRKFRVKEDPPETKTDFPWVKSQGENAESDRKFLVNGSSVLIEGFVQTRNINQKVSCEECESEYSYKDQAMEIVPYSTEYLLNCRTIEEIELLEKEQQENAFASIFGNKIA